MRKGATHAKKVMYIDFFIDLHHIFDVRRRFLSPCVSTLTHGKKAMYIDFFIDLHHKFDLHRSFLSPCVFTLTLRGSFWGSWAWADVCDTQEIDVHRSFFVTVCLQHNVYHKFIVHNKLLY